MRKILSFIYRNGPFSLKFWIDKNIKRHIEEVEFIFQKLKNKKNGVMVDVGAHIGTSLDMFLKLGWTIHAFEPDPQNRLQLEKRVNGRENVKINKEAVTDKSGLELSFFTSETSTGISGLSNFHVTHKETTKVKTITLQDYVRSNSINKIDFLKIDTEGFDLFVLLGYDWENLSHPDYIVCEFENRKTRPLGYTAKDLYKFLKEKGYTILISEWEPIVEYGLKHTWKGFAKSIDNINENCWGNFIAKK